MIFAHVNLKLTWGRVFEHHAMCRIVSASADIVNNVNSETLGICIQIRVFDFRDVSELPSSAEPDGYGKFSQTGVNSLSKKGYKKPAVFLSKSSKFHVVWTIRFCSYFTGICTNIFVRNVWRDIRLPMSAL